MVVVRRGREHNEGQQQSRRSVRLHWAVVELTMYVLVVLKDSGSSTALDDEHEGGSAQF